MAKTIKELEEIKSRVAELSAVLQELSEDELNTVFGGMGMGMGFLSPAFLSESVVGGSKILPDESCQVTD